MRIQTDTIRRHERNDVILIFKDETRWTSDTKLARVNNDMKLFLNV
jgi:hypothetical protein